MQTDFGLGCILCKVHPASGSSQRTQIPLRAWSFVSAPLLVDPKLESLSSQHLETWQLHWAFQLRLAGSLSFLPSQFKDYQTTGGQNQWRASVRLTALLLSSLWHFGSNSTLCFPSPEGLPKALQWFSASSSKLLKTQQMKCWFTSTSFLSLWILALLESSAALQCLQTDN